MTEPYIGQTLYCKNGEIVVAKKILPNNMIGIEYNGKKYAIPIEKIGKTLFFTLPQCGNCKHKSRCVRGNLKICEYYELGTPVPEKKSAPKVAADRPVSLPRDPSYYSVGGFGARNSLGKIHNYSEKSDRIMDATRFKRRGK